MDFTIGTALYFAACGIGRHHGTGTPTASTARVLLSGLGADEQLVGYKGRHRTRSRPPLLATAACSAVHSTRFLLGMRAELSSNRNVGAAGACRFAKGGWTGLAAELSLDVGRLWLRNLGRDDRCPQTDKPAANCPSTAPKSSF